MHQFTCNECSHDWVANVGQYPLRFITDEPCPKCNKLGITAEKLKPTPIDTSNKSASLLSGVGEINSRLPGDFRDFMQAIKNNTKGNNMKDYK